MFSLSQVTLFDSLLVSGDVVAVVPGYAAGLM
jgi:hypothetical protein